MPTALTGANSTAASSAPRRAIRIVANRWPVGSGRQDGLCGSTAAAYQSMPAVTMAA